MLETNSTKEGERVLRGDQREYQRQYYLNNREHLLQQASIWYASNKEKKQEYYEANKEAIAERVASNRQVLNAKRRSRYAKRTNNQGSH